MSARASQAKQHLRELERILDQLAKADSTMHILKFRQRVVDLLVQEDTPDHIIGQIRDMDFE